jgi:hypothetical protein
MSYEPYAAAAGAILGSLAEEGLEEVFPGLGELGYQGEAGGALVALLGSGLAKEEKEAVKSFVKFAYRQVNEAGAPEEISEEEVATFTENFDDIPEAEKKKIINTYKELSPYEYNLINKFLKESK